MKKVLRALFVLALIATLVGAASADAGAGCIGGKCDADAVAVAEVVDITIDGPGKVYVGDVANFTVTIDFNSFAWAEAYAKGLIGYTEAYAGAYADGLAYGVVYDPNGNIIASQFSLEGDWDWDYDSDWGWFPYAEADAYAEFPETVTFNFGVYVTEEGEWAIYAYADSIAASFAYSEYWLYWFGKYCDAYGYDFDWAEMWLYFLAVHRHYPTMRLDFVNAVEPGCMIEIQAYADWATGRLGKRLTVLLVQPDKEGIIKPPFYDKFHGGVVYLIKYYCPDGRDVVAKADFHFTRKAAEQQDIWYPFHNQAPGVFNGFYVTGGVD